MYKTALFSLMLASSAFLPLPVLAQGTEPHSGHSAIRASATTPDKAWLSIEENLRNITDALKADDLASITGFVSAMSSGIDVLLSSNIHDEVKPHEEEHLIKSLDELKAAIDGLAEVSSSNDKVAIQSAVAQVSGAVTLTRIDVPPGLLEKISGADVRAEIINTPVLQKGKAETVTLRLKSAITGKPLIPEDLSSVHTEIIHALVIDPQLTDYMHVHPEPIDIPGEYTFTMTPKTDCTYRVWADVTPVKGKQEYVMIDIPGKDGCGSQAIDKMDSSVATVDGYTATLKIPDKGISAGKDVMLSFDIRDAAGADVKELGLLMGAYAHVVGFQDDYRTIAHLHDDGSASSPVSFHFKPDRSGFVKLYLQVKINDVEKFFPFGVTVKD